MPILCVADRWGDLDGPEGLRQQFGHLLAGYQLLWTFRPSFRAAMHWLMQ